MPYHREYLSEPTCEEIKAIQSAIEGHNIENNSVLKELLASRRTIEEQIKSMLIEFESKYGVQISQLNISRIDFMCSSDQEISSVKLKIEI